MRTIGGTGGRDEGEGGEEEESLEESLEESTEESSDKAFDRACILDSIVPVLSPSTGEAVKRTSHISSSVKLSLL